MSLPTPQELLKHFASFLIEAGLSAVSVKNYLSDIRHFLNFINNIPSNTTPPTVEEVFQNLTKYVNLYTEYQRALFTPINSTNRRLASIRRFSTFLSSKFRTPEGVPGHNISPTPSAKLSGLPTLTSPKPESTGKDAIARILSQFRTYLESEKRSHSTVKNYLSDLNHYLHWSANDTPFTPHTLELVVSENQLSAYITYQKLNHTSTSLIARRQSSVKKFAKFCADEKYISRNPFERETIITPLAPFSWLERLTKRKKTTVTDRENEKPSRLKTLYRKYNELPFTPYLHLALLVLATTAMATFAYDQIINAVFPAQATTALVRPARQLSFQGRLTDSGGTPITTATSVVFRLYDQLAPPGTLLYSTLATCSVDPDQDGIFNTLIGDGVCGAEIPASVFSDNRDVFIEVQVGAETLTPRQQIATVGYALNSETLQGYPASPSATENTIPVMNNDGDILLGSASPDIISSSGTFNLEGQTLTLTTTTGSGGNIIIQPDTAGAGNVQILTSSATGDQLRIQNANLTSGNLISGYVGNDSDSPGLLALSSGSTEAVKFSVRADGQTKITTDATLADGALIVNQQGAGDIFTASQSGTNKFVVKNSGFVGIGTTSPQALLETSTVANSRFVRLGGGTVNIRFSDQGLKTLLTLENLITSGQTTDSGISTVYNLAQTGDATARKAGGIDVAMEQEWTSTASTNDSYMRFFTTLNGTSGEKVRITSAGNVGIGLTDPLAPLDVAGDIYTSGGISTFRTAVTDGTIEATQFCTDDGETDCISSFTTLNYWQRSSGSLAPINITDSVNIGSTATASAYVHLAGTSGENSFINTGNIGVGTTSPTAKLDVNGTASTSGTLSFRGTTDPKIDILNGEQLGLRFSPGGDAGLVEKIVFEKDGDITMTNGQGIQWTDFNAKITGNTSGIRINAVANTDSSTTNGFRVTSTSTGGAVNYASSIYATKSVADAFSYNNLYLVTNITADSGTQNLVRGMLNTIRLTGTSTITTAYALHGRVDNEDTGTIGSAMAAFLDANINSGGGTIDNNYGLYIGNQNVGSSSNFAIYTNAGSVLLNAGGDANTDFIVRGDTDNALIYADASTDKVGIGLTNPSTKLHVSGDIRVTGAYYDSSNDPGGSGQVLSSTVTGTDWIDAAAASTPAAELWQRNAGALSPTELWNDVLTGSTATASALVRLPGTINEDAFFNLGTGKVGIGTTTPQSPLSTYINSTAVSNTGVLIEQDGTGDAAITFLLTGTQNWSAGIDNSLADSFVISPSINLANSPSIIIKTTGEVGIGVTDPLAPLDVAGDIYTSGGISTFRTAVTDGTIEATRFCTDDGETNCVSDFSSLVNYWQRNGGALAPVNLTDDVLVGSAATASAYVRLPGTNNEDAFFNLGTGGVAIGLTTTTFSLEVNGTARINGDFTIGDATGDAVTVNADAWTFVNATTVALANVVNSLNFDSNTLTIDALNNRVGIGVTDPDQALEVNGSVHINDHLIVDDNTTLGDAGTDTVTVNSGIWSFVNPTTVALNDSVNSLNFDSNTLTIDALNERVGIGLTNPTYTLEVAGSAAINDNLYIGDAITDTVTVNSGAWTFVNATTVALANVVNSLNFDTNTFTIDALNNRVGIGLTNPGSTFSVLGNTSIGATYATVAAPTSGLLVEGNVGFGVTNPGSDLSVSGGVGIGSGAYITGAAPTNGLMVEGNVGIGTTNPLANLHVVGDASVSGYTYIGSGIRPATDGLKLQFKSGLNTWADGLTLIENAATNQVYVMVNGALIPQAENNAYFTLGSGALAWTAAYLVDGVYNDAGTLTVDVANRQLEGGAWQVYNTTLTVTNNADSTKNIVFDPTGTTSTITVGSGVGKIDVGTVDPPYSINGEKFSTYFSSMIGVKEEVTGNISTNEYVDGVGYRYVMDILHQPQGSDLWVFSKTANLKLNLDKLTVLLTAQSQAKVWYEVDHQNDLIAFYSSSPSTISFRMTSPRFDYETWTTKTPDRKSIGFVLNDPDTIPAVINMPEYNAEIVKKSDQLYVLNTNGKENREVGGFFTALIANLKAGMAVISEVVADNITVKQKLISPLAEIDYLETIDATVSGILYADNIEGGTVNSLNDQLSLLSGQYSTASAILADLQAKYGNYDTLMSEASTSGDVLNIADLGTPTASIPADLVLTSVSTQNLIAVDAQINGTLLANSLNSIGSDLYIQPDGNHQVHLLANLMILYPNGRVVINGDLLLTGTLYAEAVDTKEATISGKLALGTPTSPSSSDQLLSLYNPDGNLVGSVNDTGSADFKQIATGELIIAAGENASDASASGTTNSNATIGTAILPAGQTEIAIASARMDNNTLVYLTPVSDTKNQVLFVKSKQTGIGFTVAVGSNNNTQDIQFNYWLVKTK